MGVVASGAENPTKDPCNIANSIVIWYLPPNLCSFGILHVIDNTGAVETSPYFISPQRLEYDIDNQRSYGYCVTRPQRGS